MASNNNTYFALEARDLWHCVPHHPLWFFAFVYIGAVILTYAIQYQVVGLRSSNNEYAQLSEVEYKSTIRVSPLAMRCRVLLTLSETWSTLEAKIIVGVAMLINSWNALICFVHPHVSALVVVSACATLAVAVPHWASMQHRVASIFLAVINTAFQILINVYILRHEYALWYILLIVQVVFLGVFVLFVLTAWHFKNVSDAAMHVARVVVSDEELTDVKDMCEPNVDTEFCLYSDLLPVVEMANLVTFFVTMFLVFDPQYV